jgi:hypothetical protein
MHVRRAALDGRLQNALEEFHARSLANPPASANREKRALISSGKLAKVPPK